jgi:hypothetical protein
MFDLGGWHAGVFLMIAIDIAAVVILGMAISYGSRMWREEPRQPSQRISRHAGPR